MKMLKYELRTRRKAFLFWSVSLILLFVAGSMEFEGISGANSESIEVVLNYYPPIILALMGITEAIDFSRLDGYTWVLSYLATVMAGFYAITLGMHVVNRELVDKTFEFLFTKPRKRKYILSIKVFAGLLCLTAFAIIHFVTSVFIMNPLDRQIDISNLMLLSTVGMYLITLVFYTLSIFVCALIKRRDRSSKILNGVFSLSVLLGGVYDVTHNAEGLRLLTPLRYFLYQDASKGMLNMWYVVGVVLLSGILLLQAYKLFEKQDLTEI